MRLARPAAAAAGTLLLAAALGGARSAVAVTGRSAAGGTGAAAASLARASNVPRGTVTIRPQVVHALTGAAPTPPTTAFCERHNHIACYLPRQVQQAYNLPALYRKGITGRGQTIIIVDSFGSPNHPA